MRAFALLLLSLTMGLLLSSMSSACSYDWTYTNDRSDASKGKDGGEGEGEDGSSPPTGTTCSIKEPCAKGLCIVAGCGGIGKCVETACTTREVCTCDGERIDECVAAKEKKAIDESGSACPPPVNKTFDCYGEVCVVGAQYCQYKGGSASCVPYTTACPRDCKCEELPKDPCTCNPDAKGNVVIKC
jgi:hypothetical protein